MNKIAAIILFFLVGFSVSSQNFFVGDTSCHYQKVNYVFNDFFGSLQNTYKIDLNNDSIFDIKLESVHVYCHPVPSGPCSAPFDYKIFSITSPTSNVEFVYGPSTGTNCAYANTIKNISYGSPLASAQNWTLTGSPYVYYHDISGPQKLCGQNVDTFYVGYRKIFPGNDTVLGWLLIDSHIPGKLISYAYKHSSAVSSSFTLSQDSICIGDSLYLNQIGTGYFNGAAVKNNIFNPVATGNYQVYASNGCVNTATLNVAVLALPSPQITSSSLICGGDSLILSASPPNGLFSGNGVSSNVLYSAGITSNTVLVTYTVSDQHNCSNATTKTFSIVPLTYTMETCAGGGLTLPVGLSLDSVFTGTGVYNNYYFDASISGTGTIPVLFTSTCHKTATLNITVYPYPPQPHLITSIKTFCLGDKIPLYASPPGGYFSTNSSQNFVMIDDTLYTEYFAPEILSLDTGKVILYYAVSNNNCISFDYDTVMVEYAYSESPVVTCPNAVVPLTGYPTGGTFTGTNISANTYTAPSGIGSTDAYYSYTYPSGCHATYTITVFTNDCVGVKENEIVNENVHIYPNPADDLIHLDATNLNTLNPYQAKIVSIEGKVVKTVLLRENNNIIGLSDLAKGIYFIEINQGNSVHRTKFVITRQ